MKDEETDVEGDESSLPECDLPSANFSPTTEDSPLGSIQSFDDSLEKMPDPPSSLLFSSKPYERSSLPDLGPVAALPDDLNASMDEPPAKRPRIVSTTGTTPLLLMQKVLTKETSLDLPLGKEIEQLIVSR